MKTCLICGSQNEGEAVLCTTCGARLEGGESATSRSASGLPERSRWIIRGTLIVILILGVYAFLDQLLRTYHPVIEGQPSVAMASVYDQRRIDGVQAEAHMLKETIVVPLQDVLTHRLVFFHDPEGVQSVPLLAYVTPQGRLVTAMSKSEHCGSTEFYLQGDNIHCARCASYWNMSSMEAYACCQRYYPDPIPSTVVGKNVRIDGATVRRWESRL